MNLPPYLSQPLTVGMVQVAFGKAVIALRMPLPKLAYTTGLPPSLWESVSKYLSPP